VRVSCSGKSVTLSGPLLGGVFWTILGTAILMLAAYIYFKSRGEAQKSRFIFLAGSLISLIIIVYKSVEVAVDPEIPFYIPSSMIGFRIKPGSWGMLIGLIMTIGGALFLKTPAKKDV